MEKIVLCFYGQPAWTQRQQQQQHAAIERPDRKETPRTGNGNKPGGQKGRRGTNLEPVADPDEIIILKVDPIILPQGIYREDGFESRQVFDVEISVSVTEYRAQVLVDQSGKRWVEPFLRYARPIPSMIEGGKSEFFGATRRPGLTPTHIAKTFT